MQMILRWYSKLEIIESLKEGKEVAQEYEIEIDKNMGFIS